MIELLILIACFVVVGQTVYLMWENLRGEDNDLFVIGQRSFVGVIGLGVIIGFSLLLAGVVDKSILSLSDNSPEKLATACLLVLISFFGFDCLFKNRLKKERILLWGICGFSIILLILGNLGPDHSYRPYFVFGLGVYSLAILSAWVSVYWQDNLQGVLAIPIGFVICVTLFICDISLNNGVAFFNFNDLRWTWPLALFLISVLVIMLNFFKPIKWRKRWSYKVLFVSYAYFIAKSSIIVFLFISGDLTTHKLLDYMDYNGVATAVTEGQLVAVERKESKDFYLERIKDINLLLQNKDSKIDAEKAKETLKNYMGILNSIEQKKAIVEKEAPQKRSPIEIFVKRIKIIWLNYIKPTYEKVA